jgi:hypothetical protein
VRASTVLTQSTAQRPRLTSARATQQGPVRGQVGSGGSSWCKEGQQAGQGRRGSARGQGTCAADLQLTGDCEEGGAAEEVLVVVDGTAGQPLDPSHHSRPGAEGEGRGGAVRRCRSQGSAAGRPLLACKSGVQTLRRARFDCCGTWSTEQVGDQVRQVMGVLSELRRGTHLDSAFSSCSLTALRAFTPAFTALCSSLSALSAAAACSTATTRTSKLANSQH